MNFTQEGHNSDDDRYRISSEQRKMNNARKSMLNIVTGVFGQVITIAIGILLPRLFIGNYGSEINGFLSSINNMIVYLSLLEAGIGGATVQALYGPIGKADRNKINGILAATNIFYKRTGFVYAACVILLAIGYPLLVHSELGVALQVAIILLVGVGGVLGYLFQAKFRLLLQAEGKQYVITNITTIVHVLTSVGKLVCIILGLPVISLQILQFLLVIVQIACYYLYIHKHYKWLDLSVPPDDEAISQRKNVLVHQIAEMVFNHTDVLLLTLLVQDLRVVSVYTLYNMFVDMVSTLIGNVNSGFVFQLGQMYNTDKEKHFRVFDVYETYYMAFSFALYTVVYMFLQPFMKLYTAGISDTDYLLPLLPFFFVFYKLLVCGRAACGGMGSYAGHFKQTQSHSIIETTINLIVSIVGVIILQKKCGLGIYGVLIGTIAALLFRANVMIFYANHKILFRSVWHTYKKWLLNVVITIFSCSLFEVIHPIMDNFFVLIRYGALTGCMVLALFMAANSLCFPDNARVLQKYLPNRNKKIL